MDRTRDKVPIKKLLVWTFVHISFTFLGCLLFVYLEECLGHKSQSTNGFTKFVRYLKTKDSIGDDEMGRILNVTRGYFVTDVAKSCDFNHEAIAKWWRFTTVTCYTIGYGRVVPKTDAGKIATILYAFTGIPLTVALYTVAADVIKKVIVKIIYLVEIRWLKRKSITHVTRKTLTMLVILLIVYLFIVSFIGTLKNSGNLRLIDSVYFWFQTLTTIGYGDVIPVYPHNDVAELTMKIVFAFGMGITASVISALASLVDEINGKKVLRALSFSRRTYQLQQKQEQAVQSSSFLEQLEEQKLA